MNREVVDTLNDLAIDRSGPWYEIDEYNSSFHKLLDVAYELGAEWCNSHVKDDDFSQTILTKAGLS